MNNSNNSNDSGKPSKSNRIINAGSPSSPRSTTNFDTPPRINTNPNQPQRLIRGQRALRNREDIPPPLPLQLFNEGEDEEEHFPEQHLGPDTFPNVFMNDDDELNQNQEQPANASGYTNQNNRTSGSSGFGKIMCSLKKFVKKYMKLGHSRRRAVEKYRKVLLYFGSSNNFFTNFDFDFEFLYKNSFEKARIHIDDLTEKEFNEENKSTREEIRETPRNIKISIDYDGRYNFEILGKSVDAFYSLIDSNKLIFYKNRFKFNFYNILRNDEVLIRTENLHFDDKNVLSDDSINYLKSNNLQIMSVKGKQNSGIISVYKLIHVQDLTENEKENITDFINSLGRKLIEVDSSFNKNKILKFLVKFVIKPFVTVQGVNRQEIKPIEEKYKINDNVFFEIFKYSYVPKIVNFSAGPTILVSNELTIPVNQKNRMHINTQNQMDNIQEQELVNNTNVATDRFDLSQENFLLSAIKETLPVVSFDLQDVTFDQEIPISPLEYNDLLNF